MNKNLENEQIVLELKELISMYEAVEAHFDDYCEAMKNIFLSGSCNN